jgi:hypothetical protein
MEELKKLFYNPKEGLVSKDKLYLKAKEKGINLTRKEVNDFYDKQEINQVLKPIRKKKEFNTYKANYPGHIYQLDIIVYNGFTQNKKSYILVVIDIYSRFMLAEAMYDRELTTIIKAYEKMINQMGAPFELQADNEFNKAEFIKVLQKDDTQYRFSDANEKHKNPIVERVNGTIAKLLQKVRMTTKNYKWNTYLDDVVENYNNTVHSTTEHKPIDIFTGEEPNEQEYNKVENEFKVGDKVRVLKNKKLFGKGDVMTASKEIYVVESINNNRIYLIGVSKRFKPYELLKVTDSTEVNIIEPKTKTKENRIRYLHKRIDVNQNNIIEEKRVTKPNSLFV